MTIQTNLPGRLRNTPLQLTSGLLPLFEAVVNSIHGIEEAGLSPENGSITVEILRKSKQSIFDFDQSKKKRGPEVCEDIVGFKITDNGVGFDDTNMQSFQTLDSEHKATKGCRGIGRLLWLKAFSTVRITSIFKSSDSKYKKRYFVFSKSGVSNEEITDNIDANACMTTIHLFDFDTRYREHSIKTLAAIAESIFEHCLWYYVRKGGAPKIAVIDDNDRVLLDDIFDQQMHTKAVPDKITVKGTDFELLHVKFRTNSLSTHAIAFCANNRLVTEEKITGKIPGLYGKLSDSAGDFVYECYVSSPYLDQYARPERTGFDISETVDALFENTEISFSQIRSAVIEKAAIHLSDFVADNLKRSEERVNQFVSQRAPRYRPILSWIPKENLNIDPKISDKDLDLALHKQLAEFESQLLAEGHDIMSPPETTNCEDYRKLLNDYLSKAEDLKMSDLASYVSHRKVIIDLFAMAIRRQADGKYAREDLIHGLIMPRQKTSNEIPFDGANLWLIDERLAFHNYLASDKTLASMPITNSVDTKEPDICALNVFDNPILVAEGDKLPLDSFVVV